VRDPLNLIALRANVSVEEVRKLERRRTWQGAFITAKPSQAEERRDTGQDDDRPDTDGELRLYGYSAVFDSDSELLYGFLREQVKRGAFRKVLRSNPDVRLLENHDGRPHARTTNGTLKLTEKPRGLYRDALLDKRRQDSRDLYYGVERGDYSQSSFAFTIANSEWRYCEHVEQDDYTGCDCVWERDITEIGELFDDSVVTYPAYPATTVTVARESETTGERNVLASDEEQRDTAPDADTSPTHSVSDTATAIRLWLHVEHGVTQDVAGTEGSTRAC
jgi:uncharacterized protein